MRSWAGMVVGGVLVVAALAAAQRPGGDARGPRGPGAGGDDTVARMMEFDKDKDGKLTRAEITDDRLVRLFERADANGDGAVTKEELSALAAKEQAAYRGGGPGGPGGPRMGPPMPRPGEILPPMLRQRLNLTAEQTTQVDDLQKEVDAKLDAILTADQKSQLKQVRGRGPGGPPPGGRPGGEPR